VQQNIRNRRDDDPVVHAILADDHGLCQFFKGSLNKGRLWVEKIGDGLLLFDSLSSGQTNLIGTAQTFQCVELILTCLFPHIGQIPAARIIETVRMIEAQPLKIATAFVAQCLQAMEVSASSQKAIKATSDNLAAKSIAQLSEAFTTDNLAGFSSSQPADVSGEKQGPMDKAHLFVSAGSLVPVHLPADVDPDGAAEADLSGEEREVDDASEVHAEVPQRAQLEAAVTAGAGIRRGCRLRKRKRAFNEK
jgi:hypothetical protein